MDISTEIKVTRINNRYHARLFINGNLYDEMACQYRSDIGWICREMLRWADKNGFSNDHTSSARGRQDTQITHGKVWYRNRLCKN